MCIIARRQNQEADLKYIWDSLPIIKKRGGRPLRKKEKLLIVNREIGGGEKVSDISVCSNMQHALGRSKKLQLELSFTGIQLHKYNYEI